MSADTNSSQSGNRNRFLNIILQAQAQANASSNQQVNEEKTSEETNEETEESKQKPNKSKITCWMKIHVNIDNQYQTSDDYTTFFNKSDIKNNRMSSEKYVNTICKLQNINVNRFEKINVYNKYTKSYEIIAQKKNGKLQFSRNIGFTYPKKSKKKTDNNENDDENKGKKKKKKKKPKKRRKGKKNEAIRWDMRLKKKGKNQDQFEGTLKFRFTSSANWKWGKQNWGSFQNSDELLLLPDYDPSKRNEIAENIDLAPIPSDLGTFSCVSSDDNNNNNNNNNNTNNNTNNNGSNPQNTNHNNNNNNTNNNTNNNGSNPQNTNHNNNNNNTN
eukprot:154916_1